MITIKEIAGMLNVSTTTVSNVVHGKTKEVSPATVERIRKVLDEYHYTPNISARNLASSRSKIIAVIIKHYHDLDNNRLKDPFVSELLGAIEKCVRSKGYYLMVYTSGNLQEIRDFIMSWNTDGLVMVGFIEGEIYAIQEVCRRPMAIIDVYDTLQIESCINIRLEDQKSMYNMVRYLIRQGHKKIAFLADNDANLDHKRFLGYEEAMREAGLDGGIENFIILDPKTKESLQNVDLIYEKSFEYTAFACVSDYYAALISYELQKRGRRIPEDISITGFDDNYFAQLVRPALTTVHQDVTAKAETAIDKLLGMIEDPRKRHQETVVFTTEIVVRDSVKNLNN